MADPILPSASVLVTAAIDAIVAARPATQIQFNNPNSVYRDIPAMMRAQGLLLLARLADEVRSARLRFATGPALRALAASEFQTILPPNPQTALGSVTMARTGIASGVVPQGTLFTKAAAPQGIPLPVSAATYTTTAPVYVQANQLQATFKLVAQSAGVAANIPFFNGYDTGFMIAPSQTLFDATFAPIVNASFAASQAAGGSSGLPDPVVVAAAKAYVIGQFGPTQGALIAGLLQQQAVRHYAVFPASDSIPYAAAYIADESWADCAQWHDNVAQTIADQWTAFGGRIRFGDVVNVQVALSATFVLEKTSYLNFTDDIDRHVRNVAVSYFNDRPDWYRFRQGTLQQMLSKADPRIRKCTSVSVTNVLTGEPFEEPANDFTTNYAVELQHAYLTQAQCSTSYAPPS